VRNRTRGDQKGSPLDEKTGSTGLSQKREKKGKRGGWLKTIAEVGTGVCGNHKTK